jgi:hypothetical protein
MPDQTPLQFALKAVELVSVEDDIEAIELTARIHFILYSCQELQDA